ncbi:unnamed protein product [Symbiodinium natans]|uniref:C3H1-type domain-containing protein n=1 Tax=Symbiodinium natans TaxID=878477 RepID=A0A812PTV2_9DINO|nr:unnamed protein product [Symbiodinium natans]
MAAGWSRLSSWPCTGADAFLREPMDGVVDMEAQPKVEPVAEKLLAEAVSQSEQEGDCHDCNPCVFFASSMGCLHGVGCRFCHVHPAKKDGPAKRARKQTRDKLKAQVLGLIANQEDMQAQQDELQQMAKNNSFARAFILACLEGHVLAAHAEIPDEDRARILLPGPVPRFK